MKSHRPRKRFGQHFLADPGVIDEIVSAIGPQADEIIVEIGPGHGAITGPLLRACRHLHVIEIDRDLSAALDKAFDGDPRLTVHQGDALTFPFDELGDELRVVGNLPYNISTPLLFHLLEQRNCIRDMHFMLQKEVVDRMSADPGSKSYGRLGIMLGSYFDIEALFDVDRLAFDPPPEVTSAIVRLVPSPDPDIVDPALLGKVVAAAFSKRRKTIRNALSGVVDVADLETLGIDPGARPENVPIPQWIRLANRLAAGADRH